jgi:predicted DsbA family dithiol-disulfide isomerase
VKVRWIAFTMHPEIPEEGLRLEELFPEGEFDLAESMERLKKVAADLGLPWNTPSMIYNSRRAQELGKWAESLGMGDEFRMRVFQTLFAHELNIARTSVLREVAESIGLDGPEAEEVLARRTFKEAVDRDWEYSRTCEILMLPTFSAYGRTLVGAQPYQALEKLVTATGSNPA